MKRLFILFAMFILVSSIALAVMPVKGQKLEVKGLYVAISNVENNETVAHLESVLAKIMDKRQEQITKLQNLRIEGDGKTTYIEGEGNGKILGLIPIKKQYKYKVMEDGSIARVKRVRDAFITDVE